MKKSSLMKAFLKVGFLFTLLAFFSSFESFASVPIGKPTGKVIKSARWLNYPYAINGQRPMSFCSDVVNESTVGFQSADLQDGASVCQCQLYRIAVPSLSCAPISWGLFNATIAYSYSNYEKLIQFTSGILVDGYANVWITVTDPVTSDVYSVEWAFSGGNCCE